MSISRRKFLTVAGSGLILAAGGAGAWIATREPTRAVRPWHVAGSPQTEPRRRALSYAILAPNRITGSPGRSS
jgi:hypothetical protein